jgi:hypothetical protein
MLKTIFDLTDQVQSAIDAGDWQRANDLEVTRRARLEALVAEQGKGGELAPALVAIESRGSRLIGVVEDHRRAVLREAATVKTGHAAAAAYADADGIP